MNEDLPGLLRKGIRESGLRLKEAGFSLETFDSTERMDKKSFGIYVEKNGRGFYLTVWDSGEVQVSTIDYEVDPSPCERHLSDVLADQLRTEFEELVDWVSGSSGRI
ncbi:hypothetical protein LUX12_15350 [Streptomyces somaliensis]|uniref:hypothetical protein n=1 Tax=Streptomyces somaliensis TaxID=78355 RepID=UPI0020CCA9B8|nr:hypothetical protein [Streptomyces somaliensis]MCP9945857.1 hypothetical protein [Streptomyces somaliensis]MCP9960968.1 hypothetical protein [Streptomyces somaliensis]MCP9973754.1 hypothetical protein [Streptomyces somaliensis]